MMWSFARKVRRFFVADDGPTAVEYAVMLAMIFLVCLAAVAAVGTKTNTLFTQAANKIGS